MIIINLFKSKKLSKTLTQRIIQMKTSQALSIEAYESVSFQCFALIPRCFRAEIH